MQRIIEWRSPEKDASFGRECAMVNSLLTEDGDDHIDLLFEAALSRPPEERSAFLEAHCDDPAVREEVLSLVRAFEEGGDFFEMIGEVVDLVGSRLLENESRCKRTSARSDPLDLEGKVVAGYAVEEHLGGGGMGLVYRARDRELERPVALKFLPPHLAGDTEAARRFAREARTAATLEHPHVGTIYETGRTEDNRPFIAMAYYEGRSLKEEIEEGPLSICEVVTYGAQIAEGLSAAHQGGIVHRDVKPGNVLLTPANQVKIVDFGLAYVAEESRITESGRRLGTVSYMSPEQAQGRPVDRRTDLWGLGVVLYEMLTGERPFQADRKLAVLQAVLNEEPESLRRTRPDVPRPLRQIVRRSLAKDPGQRYASAEELVEDLETIGSSKASLSLSTSAWDWTSTREAQPTLAVFPFETFGEGEPGPFIRGIHGDLITRLANVSGLRVIGRTAIDQYAARDEPFAEITRATGTEWILEGEIQNTAGNVRVRARLVDAHTLEPRWSRSYQRTLEAERLFELQADLTKDIARCLEGELTESETERIEHEGTQDLDAYRLYLQGRRELARRMEGDIDKAFEYFQRAIRQDPDYALAWSGLADTAGNEVWGSEKFQEIDMSPEEAARRALELEPNLAEAHASMGLVHHRQHNAPAALRSYRQAIRLKPSYAEARALLGLTYLVIGRPNVGTDQLDIAVELNPDHLIARHLLYDTQIILGKPQEALEAVRHQIERYPGFPGVRYAETRALYALDRYEEAHTVASEHLPETLDTSVGKYQWREAYLATVEAALGKTGSARTRVATLEEQDAHPLVRAYGQAAIGNIEATLDELRSLETWNYVATYTARYIHFPTAFQHVREHPRFQDVLQQVNRAWGLNPDGSLPEKNSPDQA